METFCSQTLLIQGYNISFYPDKRKLKPPKRLMNISFQNIPPKTPEQIVTDFLETYADIEGSPLFDGKTQWCRFLYWNEGRPSHKTLPTHPEKITKHVW